MSAELPEPVSVRTVQSAEPPARSSTKIFEGGVLDVEPPALSAAKLTDFFDPDPSGTFSGNERAPVLSIIDAEMRSSSSIARPKTPSTDFSKFELSPVPARLSVNEPGKISPILREFSPSEIAEFVTDFLEFSLISLVFSLRTPVRWDLETCKRLPATNSGYA